MNILSICYQLSRRLILTFLLLWISLLGFSQQEQFSNSQEYATMVGERLFYGLIPMGEDVPSCSSCHAQIGGDQINWNPSALEMAIISDTLTLEQFKEVVNKPTHEFMAKVHQGYQLSDIQLRALHGYLKKMSKQEPIEVPKSNQINYLFSSGFFHGFGSSGSFIYQKIKYKIVHVLIIVVGISFQFKMIYRDSSNLGRSPNYMPDQPIKFSHQVHAGNNQIDCKYCHFNAEHGKSAGIPGPGLCMNCHLIVRDGTNSGKSEIAKVVDHFEKGKDIEWIRIHNLPDHVFFSHAQHVKAGGLDCAECHGKVEEMHIMKQENDLSMGWCLDCHKKTSVNFTGNKYYTIYKKYHDELAQGVRDSIKAVDIGANDCMKCHY